MDLSAIGYVETSTPQHILLLRLGFAAILGGAIGYERESHAAAGFRTHILIATAACLFTLLAFEIFRLSEVISTGRSDPIRAIDDPRDRNPQGGLCHPQDDGDTPTGPASGGECHSAHARRVQSGRDGAGAQHQGR